MDIKITGRNFEIDNSLRQYIYKKLGKLERLYKRVYKCEVILEKEKIRENAEAILYLKRNRIVAKESSQDIRGSIDNVFEKIKKQLRRLNGRISSQRRRNVFNKIRKARGLFWRDEATVG